MIRKSTLLIVIFLFTLAGKTWSQKNPNKPLRLEIEVKTNTKPFDVLTLGENGVLIFYRTKDLTEDNLRPWIFIYYDKWLNEVWKKELLLFPEKEFADGAYDQNMMYLLFSSADKESAENLSFIKLQYSVAGDTILTVDIPKKAIIPYYIITPEIFYVGLNKKKDRAGVLLYNHQNGTSMEYELPANGDVALHHLWMDEEKDVLKVLYSRSKRKENKLLLRSIFLADTSYSEISIPSENINYVFNAGKIIKEKDSMLIVGTYIDRKNSGSNKSSDVAELAVGFYSVSIIDENVNGLNYHSFAEFENFFMYMNENDALRLKKKAIRKQKSGKPLSLSYRLLIHDLRLYADEVVFVVESFRPEYRTVTNMDYDIYGRPIPTTYTVFEGYRYTNSFVSSFDFNGQINWDNTFRIYDVLAPVLRERINLMFDKKDILLAYNFDGEITSKLISGYESIEGQDKTQIALLYVQDKVMEDYGSDMDYWYENYFLCYGYQTIRNNSLPGKSKRTVFYMNKLKYGE